MSGELRLVVEADGRPVATITSIVTARAGTGEYAGRDDRIIRVEHASGQEREEYPMVGVRPDIKPLALAHEMLTAFGIGRIARLEEANPTGPRRLGARPVTTF